MCPIKEIFAAANNNDYIKLITALNTLSKDNVVRSVNTQDEQGRTPLLIAAEKQCFRVVCELIKAGADLKKEDNLGNTPLKALGWSLMRAIVLGYGEVVKTLLKNGVDVNETDGNGNSPLLVAIYYNHFDRAKEIITLGADVNMANVDGHTPLHYASMASCTAGAKSADYIPIIKTLIAAGANLNCKNLKGITPLRYALDNHRYDIAIVLLEQGIILSQKVPTDGKEAFNLSAMLDELRPENIMTLFRHAVNGCNYNIVKLMLEQGIILSHKEVFDVSAMVGELSSDNKMAAFGTDDNAKIIQQAEEKIRGDYLAKFNQVAVPFMLSLHRNEISKVGPEAKANQPLPHLPTEMQYAVLSHLFLGKAGKDLPGQLKFPNILKLDEERTGHSR